MPRAFPTKSCRQHATPVQIAHATAGFHRRIFQSHPQPGIAIIDTVPSANNTIENTSFDIRPIQQGDDPAVAQIIRSVMPEFGATGDGFAINDPEVDWMHRAYNGARCAYFVIQREGVVVGGGGVAPLAGTDADVDVCELRKMYFLPSARGIGAGQAMMARCLDAARALGFRRCYLETLHGMDAAMKLYARTGFKPIPAPMGDTGHGGCNRFYLLAL